MRIKSESPKRFAFNPATLIFSTLWGLNSFSETQVRGGRPEIASLYAAYASFLAR
ncbi:MAG TPA: hypothetical protein VHS80_10835 [Chthoniobacterales bacterium]|nr:hypothetical protein [Chthoniobacterales bacterium]